VPLTLVPEPSAQVGARFRFNGPNRGDECAGCPVQRLCFNLQPGHAYEVAALRDVWHPCALHDGGRVRVVEATETTFAGSVETRLLRGTAAAWAPIPCGRPDCANWSLCHPVGARPGRHEIVAQHGTLDCPAGFQLTRADLKPLESQ